MSLVNKTFFALLALFESKAIRRATKTKLYKAVIRNTLRVFYV